MYILVLEDGEVKQANEVSDGDFNCVDAGILDIIDITGPMPKQYHDGEWHELEDV